MRRDEVIARLKSRAEEIRARGVTRLALFGSYARDEARPDSDIDVLIDLDPSRPFSLVDLAALRIYLSDILARDVDVVERDSIKPLLRNEVLSESLDVI